MSNLFPIQHHGLTNKHRREYNSWLGARYRTTSPKHPQWVDYGGRGIRMCERWQLSFADFLADMGPRPEGTELDRIDNDGHYEPGNCRWVTKAVNNSNRDRANSKHRKITLTMDGVTADLAFWAAYSGVSKGELRVRRDRGWTDEQVLARSLPRGWVADGFEVVRLRELADQAGEKRNTIAAWIAKGYSVSDIRLGVRLTTEKKRNGGGYQTLTVEGRTQTIAKWADERGMSTRAIRGRLAAGASDDEALCLRPWKSGEVKAFNRKLAELNRQLKREGGQGFTIVR